MNALIVRKWLSKFKMNKKIDKSAYKGCLLVY